MSERRSRCIDKPLVVQLFLQQTEILLYRQAESQSEPFSGDDVAASPWRLIRNSD